MKSVVNTPEGNLSLSFQSLEMSELRRVATEVVKLPGARFNPRTGEWVVWWTRKAEKFLLGDTPAWTFKGDAYCEIKKVTEFEKVELVPWEAVDLSRFGLSPQMKQFQVDAVKKIHVRNHKCLVSYPPGSGKTLIACSWLKTVHTRIKKPFVIVCPSFMKQHWRNELEKWAGIPSTIVEGKTPYRVPTDRPIIINYDILFNKPEAPSWIEYLDDIVGGVIADETHYLANEDSNRTKAFRALQTGLRFKLFLTGTPIKSRVYQLWPTLNMLNGKFFSQKKWFLNRYCGPERDEEGRWSFKGGSHLDELREYLTPIMIRETKKTLMPWLPPKIRTIMHTDANKSSKEMSRKAEEALLESVDEFKRMEALRNLTRTSYADKRSIIFEWLDNKMEEDVDKVVVVAYHLSVIDDLQKKYPHFLRIDGRIPTNSRQSIVDEFQNNPNVEGIIIQLTAGGVGYTMDKAHDMVICELPWTPGELEQVEDRIHRINSQSDRGINYYYFVCDGTLEERIVDILNQKFRHASVALDGVDQEYFIEANHVKVA